MRWRIYTMLTVKSPKTVFSLGYSCGKKALLLNILSNRKCVRLQIHKQTIGVRRLDEESSDNTISDTQRPFNEVTLVYKPVSSKLKARATHPPWSCLCRTKRPQNDTDQTTHHWLMEDKLCVWAAVWFNIIFISRINVNPWPSVITYCLCVICARGTGSCKASFGISVWQESNLSDFYVLRSSKKLWRMMKRKTSSSSEKHSAPSVHIRQMAAVPSKLMLYCGAISILLT